MSLRGFTYAPPKGPLHYHHVDTDIIIVEKPSELLSVPGKSEPDCLEARIRADYPEALTIHRLDMATSGLMVFARNPAAQRHISLQFEKRIPKKSYEACIWGHPDKDEGQIDLPLITDWPNRPKQMVCHENGKAARTGWKVLAREDGGIARLALYPETGRSHQLRVHMLELGHPIIGDRLYAPDAAFKAAERLNLHAAALSLRHPTGGAWHEFNSPCPF